MWDRSVQDLLRSWEDQVATLKTEYFSSEYQDRIWNKQRARTKGYTESVSMYFIEMTGLYVKLENPATELDMIKLLQKNLDTKTCTLYPIPYRQRYLHLPP